MGFYLEDSWIHRNPSLCEYFSGIEIIWSDNEDFRDNVVLKMIEKFKGIQILCGFNQNKSRDILQGFWDEIINGVVGERGG